MNSWVVDKNVISDLKPPNSNQFILEAKWTFVPDAMKFPAGIHVDVTSTRMGLTWEQSELDLWPPKSNQFILESNWSFVPNLKRFPSSVPEISRSHKTGTDGWMNGLPEKHNVSCQGNAESCLTWSEDFFSGELGVSRRNIYWSSMKENRVREPMKTLCNTVPLNSAVYCQTRRFKPLNKPLPVLPPNKIILHTSMPPVVDELQGTHYLTNVNWSHVVYKQVTCYRFYEETSLTICTNHSISPPDLGYHRRQPVISRRLQYISRPSSADREMNRSKTVKSWPRK